ncbi:MAG: RNA 2',3'-cyclic phosphodiesterase [Terriglobales bacterium]
MRCFFAIPIAGEAARTLAGALGDWRRQQSAIRWEAPEALHLTLQFVGSWPDARVPDLAAALADWSWDAFTLTIAGLGAFPHLRRPRVLWAGVAASPELNALAADLGRRLSPLGIEREHRAFTPHISLARFESGQRPQAAARAWGACPVTEFCLYETLPAAAPATRYPIRHHFPAHGAAP